MHDMTDGWDLPPNCNQEGETFLGIPLSMPDFKSRINESPKNLFLPEDVSRKVALEYKNTYQVIQEKFGNQALELWASNKFIATA